MARLTFGDRVAAATVGAFVGSFVGFGLAWLVGVYPARGFVLPHEVIDFKKWVLFSAGGFALVGLLFGPVVGTLLGTVVTGMFESQRSHEVELPNWLAVVLLVVIAAGVWWWLSK
jgi:hypothetical protein